MESRFEDLQAKVAALESELISEKRKSAELKNIVDDFSSTKIKTGLLGETIIRIVIGVDPIMGNKDHDFLCRSGLKLEVKFSQLGLPAKSSPDTKRWSWGTVFGKNKGKVYDRLILIGSKDDRYSVDYPNTGSENFIFFDIPYDEVSPLTVEGDVAGDMIRLTTNPATVTSERAKTLFSKHLVSAETLRSRYGDSAEQQSIANSKMDN